MAQLTWRGVDAPNFSTSLDGLRTASSLLDKAFSTASGTINGIDQDISARVNKDVLARMAGISEADGAEAEIQQLLASVDPRRLSAETIMFGANRPDTLISRETDRFNLDTAQYTQGLVVDNNKRLDATEGMRRGYFDAAARGDTAAMAKFRSEILASDLRAAQMADVIGEGQDIIAGDLGVENDRFNLERGRYGFDLEKLTRQEDDSVEAVKAQLDKLGLNTVEDALAFAREQKLSPRAFNKLRRDISPMQFLDPNAMNFGGGGGAPSGGGGGAFTGSPQDAVQAFMGRVANVESGGRAGAKNPNSSASGLYQFTKGTFINTYKKVFGVDDAAAAKAWSSSRFDNNVQQQLMQQLTKDNSEGLQAAGISITPGSLYLAHFAGLKGAQKLYQNPNASAEAVLGAEAVEANPFLKGKTAGEVIGWANSKMDMGPSASAIQVLSETADVAESNAIDDITGDPIIDGYRATVGKPSRSSLAVAAELSGPKGVFAGVDKNTVEKKIREVQSIANDMAAKAGSKKRFSYDQAAFFLENSTQPRGMWDWLKEGPIRGDVLGDRTLNEKALRDNVSLILNGDEEGATISKQEIARNTQERQAAIGAYQAQAAWVAQLERAPNTNPQILTRERRKLAMLGAAIPDVIGQQRSEGALPSRSGQGSMPAPVRAPSSPVLGDPTRQSRAPGMAGSMMDRVLATGRSSSAPVSLPLPPRRAAPKGAIKTGNPKIDQYFSRLKI